MSKSLLRLSERQFTTICSAGEFVFSMYSFLGNQKILATTHKTLCYGVASELIANSFGDANVADTAFTR